MCAHMVIYRDQWVFLDYLLFTDALNGRWQVINSNSEMHMTAICDARLIYGRGGFHGYLYAVQL